MSDTLRALEDARDLISASAQLDAHNWRDGQPITEYGRHVQEHLDLLDAAIRVERARSRPGDDAWFRGGVDRELVRAVVAGEMAHDRPVAWAVLCAGGMPHKANRHTLLFAGATPDAWSKGLCMQADRESACGPHRIVPLFAGEVSRG